MPKPKPMSDLYDFGAVVGSQDGKLTGERVQVYLQKDKKTKPLVLLRIQTLRCGRALVGLDSDGAVILINLLQSAVRKAV